MASHPLDSLTAEEISATSRLLAAEKQIDGAWRYASIILREPPKTEVKAWRSGDAIVRRSLSVLWNKRSNEVFEAIVNRWRAYAAMSRRCFFVARCAH